MTSSENTMSGNFRALPGLEWRVNQVSTGLYDQIEPLLKKYASRANIIDVTVLLLSVITSGAFWALLSDAIPKQAGYAGAAMSTIVTFLTIYMYSSGLNSKRKSAVTIFKEVGKFMAVVRTQHISDESFWAQYKLLEGMITELKYGSSN